MAVTSLCHSFSVCWECESVLPSPSCASICFGRGACGRGLSCGTYFMQALGEIRACCLSLNSEQRRKQEVTSMKHLVWPKYSSRTQVPACHSTSEGDATSRKRFFTAISAWNFPRRLGCLASEEQGSTCLGIPIYGFIIKLLHAWLEFKSSCLPGKPFT